MIKTIYKTIRAWLARRHGPELSPSDPLLTDFAKDEKELKALISQVQRNIETHDGLTARERFQQRAAVAAGLRGIRCLERVKSPHRLLSLRQRLKARFEAGKLDYAEFAKRIRKIKLPNEYVRLAQVARYELIVHNNAAMKSWRQRNLNAAIQFDSVNSEAIIIAASRPCNSVAPIQIPDVA